MISGPLSPGFIALTGTIGQPPLATIARYFTIAACVAAIFAFASVGVPRAGFIIQARVEASPSSGGSSSPWKACDPGFCGPRWPPPEQAAAKQARRSLDRKPSTATNCHPMKATPRPALYYESGSRYADAGHANIDATQAAIVSIARSWPMAAGRWCRSRRCSRATARPRDHRAASPPRGQRRPRRTSVPGEYDAAIVQAVKVFQARHGLPATGVIDSKASRSRR